MEHITDHSGDRIIIKDDKDIFIRLDTLLDWQDYDGVDLNSECKAGILNFFYRLSFISLEDLQSANNIYLVEEKEVYNFDSLYSRRFKYINEIIQFFKVIGLYDKVTFLNNNFNANYQKVKHKPIVTFLFNSSVPKLLYEDLKVIRGKKFKYRFLFLNRKTKRHRTELYQYLKEKNVLDNCFHSIDCFTNIDNVAGEEGWSFTSFSKDIYESAFINVITETSFFTTDFSGNTCFITEKTDKALTHLMPFIIVGNPYSLHNLHRLGFKTFHEIWDESYDTTLDDNERFDKLKNLILEINSWSDEKIAQIMPQIMEITEHNSNRHKELLELKNKHKVYMFELAGNGYYDFTFLDNILQEPDNTNYLNLSGY